jgi:Ran GTPase-activating protein (RanGAP) involved in mRNA processing and transport
VPSGLCHFCLGHLENNSYLVRLSLSQVNLAFEGVAERIADVINCCRSLTYLDLSNALLQGAETKILASALYDNRTLREIVLKANQIGASGGVALAKALSKNRCLRSCDVSVNFIGSAAVNSM